MDFQIDNQKEERIIKKLNSFFDLDTYADFLFLSLKEFEIKYGHYGFSFNDFVSIRFNDEPNIFKEICIFLPADEYYLIPISKDIKGIFKMSNNDIEIFLKQNKLSDFIIFEIKMTWLLVYDRHRKLFGLGNYIKKKIGQNTTLKFGNTKIMFTNADTKT